jgi:hypothetical protein
MGNMACNQHLRMDTLLYLLVSPMRPLLTTRTIQLVGFDQMGAGQNAIVCVMSYSGYDIEVRSVPLLMSTSCHRVCLRSHGRRILCSSSSPALEVVPRTFLGCFGAFEVCVFQSNDERALKPGVDHLVHVVRSNTFGFT